MPLILFSVSAYKAHVLYEEILYSDFLLCRKMNGFLYNCTTVNLSVKKHKTEKKKGSKVVSELNNSALA